MDSFRNGRGIWKVRAIPLWQTAAGSRPPISSPLRRTEPAVGAYRPAIRLKVVLFPEPFGPISPRISPPRIEKLKSLPPKQREEVEDFVDFLKARKERARDEAAHRLGEAFAKLDALNQPPLTPDEVQAEIDAVRAERRTRHADRR